MERKDRIMMTIYEQTSPEDIREIAKEWLDLKSIITAIQIQLNRTESKDDIKVLEGLVWKK